MQEDQEHEMTKEAEDLLKLQEYYASFSRVNAGLTNILLHNFPQDAGRPVEGRSISAVQTVTNSQEGENMADQDHKIGEDLPDGRVCAGISPRTGKTMYVNGEGGGDLLTWEEAQVAMKNLAPFGWRLPTKDEMAGVRMASRRGDEKDSDPFRQQRLPALFMRAGSDPPVTLAQAQGLAARAGGLPSRDEVNPFPPVKGDPKPGGPG